MARVLLPIFLAAWLLGCGEVILTQWPEKKTWASFIQLQEVKPGMSRDDVEGIMGPPAVREAGDFQGGHYVIYFYRTHNMDYEDGNTVRGGYTPMVFKNDVLVGMGKRQYRLAVDRYEDAGRPLDMPWERTQ
jgi:outer membrane protein assembly factor BamE (lipoprotein component of BamABCDE complex)